MAELSNELIGGRIQMIADREHGKTRWGRGRQHLVIEAARMYVRALEYGHHRGSTHLTPREYIGRLAAAVVEDGAMDPLIEQVLTYFTAACDPDPALLERLVAEDQPSWKMFGMMCQIIQHIITFHAERTQRDPLKAFLEVSK